MERHAREMEAQAAADRALGIVGDAMVSSVYVKGKSDRPRPRNTRDGRGKENSAPRGGRGEEKSQGEGKCGDDDEWGPRGYRASESKSKESDDDFYYNDNGRGSGRGSGREKRSDYREALLSRSEQTMLGMRDGP
jgi:hypothetical protein